MQDGKEQKEVFISYSTKDSELAHFLCNQLEGSGATCWIAPRDIPSGAMWAEEIVKGIQNARVFLLLVSEASMASSEVAKEIDLANSMKKVMIPVRIDNVTLKGGALYHLSNKQWVDALEEDKFVRFNATIDVVLKILRKDFLKKELIAGSIADMARSLAMSLNQKHKDSLNKINTMFTCYEKGKNVIDLMLRVTIGASGVDLRFVYDGNNREMQIYGDAANDGDPIKDPFVGIIRKCCYDLFPNVQRVRGARRWRFVEFVPKVQVIPATSLFVPPPEKGFDIFKENVTAFSEKVLPKLFQWVEYSQDVIDAINKLEERLREIFPKSDGWSVGAPEGSRLNGCWRGGRICIYKEKWQPVDNYKNRGGLSLALQSERSFISDLYIGILKYEPWMTLGGYHQQIVDECTNLLGNSDHIWGEWVWCKRLEDKWSSSGIAEGESKWDGKLDEFLEYCTQNLEVLGSLAPLLDQACSKLEALQVLEGDLMNLPPEVDQALILHNKLIQIADLTKKVIDKNFPECGMNINFRHRGDWFSNSFADIIIQFNVERFDAAILLRCSKYTFKIEITNLEPPDFETNVIKDFLKRRNIAVNLLEKNVEQEFNGSTFIQWLDEFKHYVEEQVAVLAPAIIELKRHLTNMVELTRQVERELNSKLSTEEGWVVDNKAYTLERYNPIEIWNKKWVGLEADQPMLVFQITPEAPCFDDLTLVVRMLDRALPEVEKHLGEICGACDFAFGKRAERNAEEIWKKPFDDPFNKTGGSHFEVELSDEHRKGLIKYTGEIAKKLVQMEEIITEVCRLQNQEKHKNALLQLIHDIINSLSQIFLEQEGWEYFQNADSLSAWSGIYFYKRNWKKEGLERAIISYGIECGDDKFEKLFIGINKGSDSYTIDPTKEQLIFSKMTDLFGTAKSSPWWIYYKYLPTEHRYTNNIINNREAFSAFIKDIFLRLKDNLTPLIDDAIKTVALV